MTPVDVQALQLAFEVIRERAVPAEVAAYRAEVLRERAEFQAAIRAGRTSVEAAVDVLLAAARSGNAQARNLVVLAHKSALAG